MYLTPGHTLGTISTLVPVRDGDRMHLVAEWGGTGFNFDHSRARFETYAASAQRFGNIVAQVGADVHIANHTNQDNSPANMAALEKRKAGDPHPTWSAPTRSAATSWSPRRNAPAPAP
jgi:metallo-beta-lactamase class B